MTFIIFRHICAFIFSLSFSLYLVPGVIRTALQFKIVDFPDGKLKNHKKPTPYLGVVGIYISFIISLMLIYPFQNNFLWIVLGTTLLMFIGLVDDFNVLKPSQKFFGQFIVVLAFLKNGFALKTAFFADWFNLLVSAFWMLSIINAINLIDVMDGLATLVVIMGLLSFFVISLIFKEYLISLFLIPMLGSLLGFFYYNKPAAKIYLGDGGSLFLGGFLAAIPLIFPWSTISYNAYYVPVIILAIPLLEVVFLVLIRTFKGMPFYNGSPHHFCIYLKNKGWSLNSILAFVVFASFLLFVFSVLFLFNFISSIALFFLSLLFFVSWVFIIYR